MESLVSLWLGENGSRRAHWLRNLVRRHQRLDPLSVPPGQERVHRTFCRRCAEGCDAKVGSIPC